MKNYVLICCWLVQFFCILYGVDGWSNFSSTQILHGVFAHYDTCHCVQIVTVLPSDCPVTSYVCLVVSLILPLLSPFLPLEYRVASTPDILPMIIERSLG